jgi:phage shock protein A
MLFGWKPKPPPVGYDELSDKIDRVERQVKMLELEWESTYNKLRSILARLNKRSEREAEVTPSPSGDGYGSAPVGDDIDRLIALRRGRR